MLRRQELRWTFADRFLALAADPAGEPATSDAIVDGLTWVISQCPDDARSRQAVERLLQGPILSERLAMARRGSTRRDRRSPSRSFARAIRGGGFIAEGVGL